MQHLDEGTIHAWLDGELAEFESDAAARHVAECAECAALVAEARGMIAGAARIVAALDAGPAGVVPKAPDSARPSAAGFGRRFASSPARMAMAATILVAVGVTLTIRRAAHEPQVTPGPVTETRAAVSPPIAPASPAPRPSSAPAPAQASTGESKDREAPVARSKQTSTVAPKTSARDEAGFAGSLRQTPPSPGASAAVDPQLADKKKDADARSDRREAAKALAGTPQIQAAPAPVRADSARSRQMLAKAADSIAAQPAPPTVQRLEAANRSPMREAGAVQSQNSRATRLDAISEASLQGCYRLSGDMSAWRGVLPAAFMLASPLARSQLAARGGQGGQGAESQKPASANAIERFSDKPNPTGFGVHAIGANGQPDSTAIGDWTIVGPMTARARFTNVDQAKEVTVLISGGAPLAHITVGGRSDSLGITRIDCRR